MKQAERTPPRKITIAFITVQVYSMTPYMTLFHYSLIRVEKHWPFYQFRLHFSRKGLVRIEALFEVVRKKNNY